MERIGKTEINGINLYQTLSDLIQSEIYLTAQEGDENNSGGKEILIDKVFNRFKTQAKFEMIEEYNLSGKIEQAQEEKYELRLPGEGRDFIGGKEILPRRGN